jgi:hypothetical protein
VFFSQQTTTQPHPDARLDRQHPEKIVFVVGDREEAGGLWVLLMVIFGLLVNFFWSFLLVAGVVDFWISTTSSTTIWTKIWRGSRWIHGPFIQISPDLTGPFSRSRWISPERRKKT